MTRAFLLLGSNMGNRKANIDKALKLTVENAGKIALQSAIYETEAWGNTCQDAFLNMVVEIDTLLSAPTLLHTLQNIELEMDRQRHEHWGPRTIDIDILFYENIVTTTSTLTIPHPLLHKRRFTLVPLTEIAADYIHPIFNQSIEALLAVCTDNLSVNLYHEDN